MMVASTSTTAATFSPGYTTPAAPTITVHNLTVPTKLRPSSTVPSTNPGCWLSAIIPDPAGSNRWYSYMSEIYPGSFHDNKFYCMA